MNTIVKRIDTTYGGYDYVEFNAETMSYHTGISRSHKGHYEGNAIEIQVKSVKELKEVRNQLVNMGFSEKEV